MMRIFHFSMALGIICFGFVSSDISPAAASDLSSSIRSERFDDWSYRCADARGVADKKTSHCEVTQIAQVRQGDKTITVLTLAIAKTAPDDARKSSQSDLVLTALVPLNVMLPAGLRLSVGERDIDTFVYRNCNEAGCWVQQKLNRNILSQFKTSSDAQAHLRLMNGESVDITFSLRGLNKALVQLQKPAKV